MNQSELFHLWVTGQVTDPTAVGTVWAWSHRLFYGPMGSSLALRHNDMVLVSAINRTGNVPRAVINTHRTKLYHACRLRNVEFNHAISSQVVVRRPGHPSSLMVVRGLIERMNEGGPTPVDFFQFHESYGHALSFGNPDQRVMTRYLFICRMLGTDPIHDTIEEMREWHRCVSILSPP